MIEATEKTKHMENKAALINVNQEGILLYVSYMVLKRNSTGKHIQ